MKAQKKAGVPAPKRSSQIPVTVKMLTEVKYELKSAITSAALKSDARFKRVDAAFIEVHSRIDGLDAKFEVRFDALEAKFETRFSAIDAKFDALEAKFEARFARIDAMLLDIKSDMAKLMSAMHRLALIVEEQEARNKFALDGYAAVWERLDRIEKNHGQS